MKWIIRIEQNENGSHDNQTWNDLENIPEGYAVFSKELESANELENFPFGNIVVDDVAVPILDEDGNETGKVKTRHVVTTWEPLPIPDIEEETAPTIADKLKESVEAIVNEM